MELLFTPSTMVHLTRNGRTDEAFRGPLAAGKDQGFSITESLVAILILAITLTGGLSFFFNANDLYYRRLHARIAVSLAEEKMEQCRSVPAAGLPTTSVGICALETNFPLGSVISGLKATRTVTITGTTLRNINVIIRWCEAEDICDEAQPSSYKSVALETYIGP